MLPSVVGAGRHTMPGQWDLACRSLSACSTSRSALANTRHRRDRVPAKGHRRTGRRPRSNSREGQLAAGAPVTRIGYGSLRRRADGARMREPESSAVAPHPVEHNGKAAGDGHDGAFHPASLRDLHAPSLEPTLRLRMVEHDGRRLEKRGAHVSISCGADRTNHVALAGLLAPRRQAEMGPDHS